MASTPVVVTDANQVFDALETWIKQKPGLNPADYGLGKGQTPDRKMWWDAWKSYRAEVRDIGKDRKRAMAALEIARNLTPAKPELLADSFRAFSGRLEWITKCPQCGYDEPRSGDWSGTCPKCFNRAEPRLEYTTGQYWPTEYRKAAASVLETYIAAWKQWHASENPQSFVYSTVQDVIDANRSVGQHFFDKSTLRFFRSRIASKLYRGKYFVTSEQFDDKSPRLFTIRMAEPDGSVDTIGEFQQYRSVNEAVAAIRETA